MEEFPGKNHGDFNEIEPSNLCNPDPSIPSRAIPTPSTSPRHQSRQPIIYDELSIALVIPTAAPFSENYGE